MAIATFKRIEKKYCVDSSQLAHFSHIVAPYFELDEYGQSRIDSLYYDTPDRSMITRSLEKPLYKEKLRVRAYSDISTAQEVFVEIKKKYKGVVYKRRVRMSRRGAEAYLSGVCSYTEAMHMFPLVSRTSEYGQHARGAVQITDLDLQISKEIDAVIARNPNIAPSMLITCTRTAYRARRDEDDGLRLTFDEHIGYRDLFVQGSDVLSGEFIPLTGDDEFLMEVKAPGSVPLWFSHALASAQLYPTSFSKYGNAYLDTISTTKGRHCA